MYKLQIFLLKDQQLALLQYENQAMSGKLKKHVCNDVIAIPTNCVETRI